MIKINSSAPLSVYPLEAEHKTNGLQWKTLKRSDISSMFIAKTNTYIAKVEKEMVIYVKRRGSDIVGYLMNNGCFIEKGARFAVEPLESTGKASIADCESLRQEKLKKPIIIHHKREFVVNSLTTSILNLQKGVTFSLCDDEFVFIHNFFGLLRIVQNNYSYEIKEKESIILSKADPITLISELPCSCFLVQFEMNSDENCRSKLLNQVIPASDSINRNIHRMIFYDDNNYNHLLFLTFEKILDKIIHPVANKKETLKCRTKEIKQVCKFIEDHLDESIPIYDICHKFQISRTPLQEAFKHELNMSPLQYINDRRLNKAFHLIASKEYSISDVASRCGFRSLAYFSKLFKKKYNISPSDYAKSLR